MGRIRPLEWLNLSFGEWEHGEKKQLERQMKWTRIGIGKGWINAAVNKDSIFYHKILTKRKTIDQPSLVVLAFLTILIKKKCLADWLINQPILLNQNK